jgi:hypothetical protein
MSRADERIRRDLQGLERPVRTDVFERVASRRHRRRALHRAGVTSLAVAVVAGSLLGGYGLLRIFAPAGKALPGDGASSAPKPQPTVSQAAEMCQLSSADTLDLNGDGRNDLVEVYFEPPSPETACLAADRPGPYHAHVEISTGPDTAVAYTQDLPECEPYGCRVFATPDLDGDGANEVAIQLAFGASTTSFAIYRFDPLASVETGALHRLEIAEPGDPWDQTYGLVPGPATFTWYGSVTHQQWLSCDEDPEHRPALITALRSEEDPGLYLVHGTLLRLVGQELRPEFSWDEEVREDRLRVPTTMCGAELIPAG